MSFYIKDGVVEYEGWRNSQVEPWLLEIERHYLGCIGLEIPRLAKALSYDPETGHLVWIGSYSDERRGGARVGERIIRSGLMVDRRWRNTIGVIYLLYLGELPRSVIPFRNGDGNDWSWNNISPLYRGEEVAFTTHPMRGRRDSMLRKQARQSD